MLQHITVYLPQLTGTQDPGCGLHLFSDLNPCSKAFAKAAHRSPRLCTRGRTEPLVPPYRRIWLGVLGSGLCLHNGRTVVALVS